MWAMKTNNALLRELRGRFNGLYILFVYYAALINRVCADHVAW